VFFPGAIVALKGRPGKKFTIREVLRVRNPGSSAWVLLCSSEAGVVSAAGDEAGRDEHERGRNSLCCRWSVYIRHQFQV